jgi:P pilus assembly chaperone PapD
MKAHIIKIMAGIAAVAGLTLGAAVPAQAVSTTKWVYCSPGDTAATNVRNTSGSSVNVQVWSYDGTQYLRSYSIAPYSTLNNMTGSRNAVQFRYYSATWGWSAWTGCIW